MLSMFTIGQAPDILQVTYDGEMRPENLRIVTFENRQGVYKRVAGFSNDLDDADRMEIHNFAMLENPFQDDNRPIFTSYSPLPDTSQQSFDRERVFAAVYAQARNSKQEILPWHELPVRVAASMYREQLLQINYDDLYDIREEQPRYPLPEYKSMMRIAMRNNGILAFRLVHNASGAPLIRGRIYRDNDLLVSQIRELKNPKMLRDRGIKIIFSSFGDLFPVNDIINKQRLNTWETPWERELALNMANHELDALRVGSRARINAQQDLWRSLRQLFNQNEYTDEALALLILQSLEKAAAEPGTQALLPDKAIDMIRHMQLLLLPAETASPPVRQPQTPQGGGGVS